MFDFGNTMNNSSNYVIFDLETTGLSPEEDSVIEISAVKVSDGNIVDEFSTLVNPGIHIPYAISEVTGITDDMVKESPDIECALKDFMSFIGDYTLVGHNIIRFDMKFIQRDSQRLFGKQINNKCIDTLFWARRYLPELDHYSLENLSYHYGISYVGAHRALVDCKINHQIYQLLLKEAENPSEAAKQVKVCPRCGNVLRLRKGMYGDFWGCASFPDCKYTQGC